MRRNMEMMTLYTPIPGLNTNLKPGLRLRRRMLQLGRPHRIINLKKIKKF
ncbi:MAG: hypothetical protein ACXAAI_02420 [Promethearchaeota archaeon]